MASTIKVDNVQNQPGTNIIDKCGTTITLGQSGDTISLASGASQTGFGRTGTVDWVTTPKTSTFTGVSGNGYFINSGSSLTCNLPAGTAGDIISFYEYARNFATYNFIISANGSELIGGQTGDATLDVNGQAATFVYVDGTKGWVNIQNAEDTQTGLPPYISATGGTITESGNFRIHTFTGPGTFTVSSIATASPAPGFNTVSYAVVAGGGGGGGTGPSHVGAGGGAGGYREYKGPEDSYTASPLDGNPGGTAVTVTATGYPITVGAAGSAGGEVPKGGTGGVSTFSTVTSAGGGGGGSIGNPGNPTCRNGANGGSGGGGSSQTAGPGGTGNTPPTTPAQGTNGAQGVDAPPDFRGGGGGGATVAGTNGQASPFIQGAGGAGATSSINATPTARAGGGGSGASYATPTPGLAGVGGTGGGGNGGTAPGCASRVGNPGTVNTGGGGGGAAGGNPGAGEGGAKNGGAGGSGVVILRYRYQ